MPAGSDNYSFTTKIKVMKKRFFSIMLGLCAVLFFSREATSQEKPFIVLEYMHVKPGNAQAYLQVENFWQHIHQAQLKNGTILTWSVWQVVAPYDMNAPYQFVAVTAYAHFNDYLHPYKGIDIRQVFAGASEDSLNKMFTETGKARDLIRSDIFKVQDNISDDKDTKYVLASYLKVSPDKEQAFHAFMNDHRKPLAEDVVTKGFADQWWYGGLMFPEGSGTPYNHIICVQWDRDDMFDREPPFDQYRKKDPAAFEGYKWFTDDHSELLHKVVSLGTPDK